MFLNSTFMYRDFPLSLPNLFYYISFYEIVNNKNSYPTYDFDYYKTLFENQWIEPINNSNKFFNDMVNFNKGEIIINSDDSSEDIGYKFGKGSYTDFNKFRIKFDNTSNNLTIGSASFNGTTTVTIDNIVNGIIDDTTYREAIITFTNTNDIPSYFNDNQFIIQNNIKFYINIVLNTSSDDQIENLVLGINNNYLADNLMFPLISINGSFSQLGKVISMYKYYYGITKGLKEKYTHYIKRVENNYIDKSQNLTNKYDNYNSNQRLEISGKDYPFSFLFTDNILKSDVDYNTNIIILHYQHILYLNSFFNRLLTYMIERTMKGVFDGLNGNVEKIDLNDEIFKGDNEIINSYPDIAITSHNNLLTIFESIYNYEKLIIPFRNYEFLYNNDLSSTTMNIKNNNIWFNDFNNINTYLLSNINYIDYYYYFSNNILNKVAFYTNHSNMKYKIKLTYRIINSVLFSISNNVDIVSLTNYWKSLNKNDTSVLTEIINVLYSPLIDLPNSGYTYENSFFNLLNEEISNKSILNIFNNTFINYNMIMSLLIMHKSNNVNNAYDKYGIYSGKQIQNEEGTFNFFSGLDSVIGPINSYHITTYPFSSYYSNIFRTFISIMKYNEPNYILDYELTTININDFKNQYLLDYYKNNNITNVLGINSEIINEFINSITVQ